jgi:acetyl esterase/lipase
MLRAIVALACWLCSIPCWSNPPWPEHTDANVLLTRYFRAEVDRIEESSDLRRFASLEQWQAERSRLRDELADMLGLLPPPAKNPLDTQITGRIERDGIIVENLAFQSFPGLYVTANLYRPANVNEPLPAILYVCGHSVQRETVDGKEISYGNKTGYQRHGAWLARHGYVCLTIDTVQWGEFLGSHWSTYRGTDWGQATQGYTPAGVETWNGIRALDYLVSRPEVDASRIGLTGRSGGGAYSWFIAALDDRPRVVVPVAGITDLRNHVIDGCVSGHCDCMYMVNYYRWDYPQIAALIAPRPLLLSNSDNDSIFPLDGVLRTSDQTRYIYELYDARENLGLLVTPGPHKDTPELQTGAFRWFDRHLQSKDVPIDEGATERFDRAELKVFDSLPDDQRVQNIQDDFVQRLQRADTDPTESSMREFRQRSLAGWPQQHDPLDARMIWSNDDQESPWQLWEFTSQHPWRLRALVYRAPEDRTASRANTNNVAQLRLVDDALWQTLKKQATGDVADNAVSNAADGAASNAAETGAYRTTIYLAVRGVGPHAWSGSEDETINIERRFYLLGQTLAAMQAYDAVRGIELATTAIVPTGHPIEVTWEGNLQGIAALATGLTDAAKVTTEAQLPADYQHTTPLLGAGRVPGFEALFSQ